MEPELFNQEKRRIRDDFTGERFLKLLTRDDYLCLCQGKTGLTAAKWILVRREEETRYRGWAA